MNHTFSDGRKIYLDYSLLVKKYIFITNFQLNDDEIYNLKRHPQINKFDHASGDNLRLMTEQGWLSTLPFSTTYGEIYEIEPSDLGDVRQQERRTLLDSLKSSAVNNNKPKSKDVRIRVCGISAPESRPFHSGVAFSATALFEIDTNFKLTPEQFQKLRDSEGVAWLYTVNPYKYRLMVADLFEDCKNPQWVENLVKTSLNY